MEEKHTWKNEQYWSTLSLQHTPMLFRILSLFRFFTEFYAKYSLLIKAEFSQNNRLIWYIGQALTLIGSPKSNYIRSLLLPLTSHITAILTNMTQEGGRQDIPLSKRGAVLLASCSVGPYKHQDYMGNRQSLVREDFICPQISYKRPGKAAFCCCFSLWWHCFSSKPQAQVENLQTGKSPAVEEGKRKGRAFLALGLDLLQEWVKSTKRKEETEKDFQMLVPIAGCGRSSERSGYSRMQAA